MQYRNGEEPDKYEVDVNQYGRVFFEQIYWCALYLYRIGEIDDMELMWRAKTINFDLYCAFDVQFLVGAGVDQTLEYLESKGLGEAKTYMLECRDAGAFDNLEQWYDSRKAYFA